MGLRAYFLADFDDSIEQQEFLRLLRELEEIPGVDFVDPVIGSRDMVIMVDAPVTVEALASKIKNKIPVKNMEILRVVSMYERHTSSKKELLKSMLHSGV